MKHILNNIQNHKTIRLVLAIAIAMGSGGRAFSKAIVLNPYKDVSWAACGRYKANLHTHTTQSDGVFNPNQVIDAYKARGYNVLALTDHNEYTWPWGNWGRDPANLGMVAIDGCEASKHHHTNTFYCNYNGSSSDIDVSLSTVKSADGLAQLNHPGRYNQSLSWYKNLYDRYAELIAMEVYNQGRRYDDRQKWDSLLTQTMPERPIWATSGDDMHTSVHLGRNWNVLLINNNSLDSASVRSALKNGCFYACYDGSGDASRIVALDSLKVTGDNIRVYANCPESDIHWISNAKEVAQGATLSLATTKELGEYVRAEIYGSGATRTLTQPIGLRDVTTLTIRNMWATGVLKVSVDRISSKTFHITANTPQPATAMLFDMSGRHIVSGMISSTRPLVVHGSAKNLSLCLLRVKSAGETFSEVIIIE